MRITLSHTILRWVKYALSLFLLPFFFVSSQDTPDAVVVSWGVILAAVGICMYREYRQRDITLTKSILWISGILTVLFVVMLSLDGIVKSPFFAGGYLSDRYGAFFCGLFHFWAYVPYLLSIFVSVWLCIYSFLEFFLEEHGVVRQREFNAKKMFPLCFGAITVWSVVSLLSTFPGIWISDDVATVLYYVDNKYWSNWHPFPYLLLVRLCKGIYNSSFSVNAFHTIVWVLLNYYILRLLKDIHVKCMLVYTVLLCVATTPFTYLEVMYKDTIFAMGLLGVTAVLIRILWKKEMTRLDFVTLNGAGLLVTLFRHAGEAAVFVMCLSCGLYFWKNRKVMWRFIATLFIQLGFFVLFYVILFEQFQVSPNAVYVKYGTPMAMVGAAVSDGMTFDEEDQAQLERVMSLEEWGNCYNKYWADSISRSWGTIGDKISVVEQLIQEEDYGSFLIKLNAKILVKNPRLYLRAFFDMNSILWEMGMPDDYDDMSLCQVEQNAGIRYTSLFRVTDLWSRFLEELPITHTLFQRGGFSIFAIVSIMVVLVMKRRWQYLLAIVPIVFHDILLFITIPAQDPRYALPTIECAILLIALLPGLQKLIKPEENTPS